MQIFVAGQFVGGASELIALIDGGGLDAKLAAAQGKPAFPADIADLVAQHVGAAAEAPQSLRDKEAQALGDALASEMTWQDRTIECALARRRHCAQVPNTPMCRKHTPPCCEHFAAAQGKTA